MLARGQAWSIAYDQQNLAIAVTFNCSQAFLPPRSIRAQSYTTAGNRLQYYLGLPNTPDQSLTSGSVIFIIFSDNPLAFFESIQGGQICVASSVTNATACDSKMVTARNVVFNDRLLVTLPEPRPPLPDMTNTVPLEIATDGTMGFPCGSLAVQIGYEEGNSCLEHG